jgi:hypothetical protein
VFVIPGLALRVITGFSTGCRKCSQAMGLVERDDCLLAFVSQDRNHSRCWLLIRFGPGRVSPKGQSSRYGVLVEIRRGEKALGGVVRTQEEYGSWQFRGVSRRPCRFR